MIGGTLPDPGTVKVVFRSASKNLRSEAHSGKFQFRKVGSHRWTAEITFRTLRHLEANELFAFLVEQEGQLNAFDWIIPELRKTADVPQGTPVVTGAHAAGVRVVNTQGWDAGDALEVGAMLKFSGHNKLYKVVSALNGGAVGISPALRADLTDGEALVVTNIPMRVRLSSDAAEKVMEGSVTQVQTITVVEDL